MEYILSRVQVLEISEGSFAIARHYQLEVARTEDKEWEDSQAAESPIAHRTRSQNRDPDLLQGFKLRFSENKIGTSENSLLLPSSQKTLSGD